MTRQATLSPAQFAERLGVTRQAVMEAICAGRIPSARKVAGRWQLDPVTAAAEWEAYSRVYVSVRSKRTYQAASAADGNPIVIAWNAYVDAMETVEAQLDEVFAAHARALGYDPEAETPVPKAGLEAWRQLAAADHAAVQAFRRLGDALEAAGVGITFATPGARTPRGRPAREEC